MSDIVFAMITVDIALYTSWVLWDLGWIVPYFGDVYLMLYLVSISFYHRWCDSNSLSGTDIINLHKLALFGHGNQWICWEVNRAVIFFLKIHFWSDLCSVLHQPFVSYHSETGGIHSVLLVLLAWGFNMRTSTATTLTNTKNKHTWAPFLLTCIKFNISMYR